LRDRDSAECEHQDERVQTCECGAGLQGTTRDGAAQVAEKQTNPMRDRPDDRDAVMGESIERKHEDRECDRPECRSASGWAMATPQSNTSTPSALTTVDDDADKYPARIVNSSSTPTRLRMPGPPPIPAIVIVNRAASVSAVAADDQFNPHAPAASNAVEIPSAAMNC